jgi:hypothetical protein
MRVSEAKCLDCHTSPDTAPPKQIELYGRASGYGWKLGDVVAAQTVYVPVSQAFRTEKPMGLRMVAALAAVSLLGVGGSLWFLLRRM